MKLRFIGQNGSMGLQHCRTYDVKLETFYGNLVVRIKTGLFSEVRCPYESLEAFAKNWDLDVMW